MVNYQKVRANAAVAAMHAILESELKNKPYSSPEKVAHAAVSFADALVKKLKEAPKKIKK